MCQKTKTKDCVHCLESFEARRSNHIYCTASCRVKACYKRRGYTYVSGRYVKPSSVPLGAATGDLPMVGQQQAIRPTTGVEQLSPTASGVRSDGITLAGIAENAIGSGLVTTAKYLAHDKPLMDMIKELHEVLVAQPRRILQQQALQMGKGIKPLAFPLKSSLSQPLDTKRLGLDSNPFQGGMMMGS